MGSTVVCYDNLGGNVRSAYVNIGDIPEELVSALNRCAKDSAQHVTAKDVGNFINGVLQRFYSTSFWPLSDEDNTAGDVDRDSDPNNGEVKLFENKEHQQLTDASPGMVSVRRPRRKTGSEIGLVAEYG
ncbi:hypothetical protein GCK32_003277 [Trichostrongylus colubriformis]|uniref:Uncharacterized protein n=1 Tax=Trichostrongylus colubriformis TaxID=6319 RepID=A0AAN8IUF8_TRICO